MHETRSITIVSNRTRITLALSAILYVLVIGRKTEIHISGGKVYTTRMPLSEFENVLGDSFINAS
ncbi:MAG: hypothetical protein MR935_02900 [Agathobaculum sp.]|uniref:LytTR family transcriptional regulator DNA-binding domain-containing protein n=1 Tax=Agathobaculum sp. TaxID=2048138 RepID=UPI0025BF18BA|nr:LytTR family transcriptional regulator DNA-binding domain-containing protein [Agathobaculum sp.]MCI7125140.1 hypothetical protein [Agathobaculum sp.]MDY3711653.1 hypothetical protein [Agathobaculum sp.]